MIAVQPWMLLAIIPIVIVVEGPELNYQTVAFLYNDYQPGLILLLIFIGGILAFLMEFSE